MQITTSSIWKSSVFVFLSQLSRLLTNFLIFILIARFYGVEQFGQFSLAFAVANICLVLADFGFDVLITTEVAVKMRNSVDLIKKYFTTKLFFIVLSTIVMFSLPTLQNFSSKSSNLIYLLIPYVVFTSFTNFLYAIFRGFEKFKYETNITLISNAILLLTIIIFGFFNQSLETIILVFIFARLISSGMAVSKIFNLFDTNIFIVNYKNLKTTFKKVFVFGFHFVFGNLFFMIDTVLLGIMANDEAVGLYQAAFKIMILLLILPDILRSALLPLTSRLFKLDRQKWESVNKLVVKLFMFIAIPISISLYFFASEIVFIIYGDGDFIKAVPILKIFAIIVFIRFYIEAYGLMLTTSNKQHIRLIIALVATTLSIVLNYSFLIPSYGIMGAAYSALLVNGIVGIFYIIVNGSYFIKWTFDIRTLMILALVTVLIFYQINIEENYLLLLLSLFIYVLVLFFWGVSKKEKSLFVEYFIKTV